MILRNPERFGAERDKDSLSMRANAEKEPVNIIKNRFLGCEP